MSGEPEGIDFNHKDGGKDVEFVLSNPVCLAVITTAYAITKSAIAVMNGVCGTGSSVPRVVPSPILDTIDIAKATVKASGDLSCAVATTTGVLSLEATVAMLFAISEIADYALKNSRVCGSNWIGPNTKKYLNNNPIYKKKVQDEVENYLEDPLLKSKLNFNDKYYREWYYNGEETEDNPDSDEVCEDVSQEKINYDSLGANATQYPRQKYYMRGLETGNFNCKKYDLFPGQNDPRDGSLLTNERLAEYRKAFECCKRRSEQYICIEYLGEKKFCRGGSKCEMKGIHFEAKTIDNGRLICAQSYSLCPYNFYLGGGSESCDYYQDGMRNEKSGRYEMITVENVKAGICASKSEIRNPDCTYNIKAGRCRNYCQYLRHCTIANQTYQYKSGISSAYFSEACLNFVGDSQNRIAHGTGFIAGSARHFSAPIAQCIKETLENVFYNRAGHTRCLLDTDVPNSSKICENGNDYKKGDQVKNESFFTKIQRLLHGAVQMTLTLSIVFYGMKILNAMVVNLVI